MKKILILGGAGFIGHHMARKQKNEGNWVRVLDIEPYTYGNVDFCSENITCDLRDKDAFEYYIKDPKFDEVYNFAAWMGGAGVIFSGKYDADILHDNLLININTADLCKQYKIPKLFYASSACCYNHKLQLDPNNTGLKEDMAYPAWPDSDYGFEKLTAERLYLAYNRNYNLNVRIARFHNIFGPEGSWNNGKEKAPAAICRKVAEVNGTCGEIEIWGDGNQTRSFLFIDECITGILKLMNSDWSGPVNIGSEEMVSINTLVKYVAEISGKQITIKHIDGPLGVRGRTSDNKLIKEKLNWEPNYPLRLGLEKTYNWIENQLNKR